MKLAGSLWILWFLQVCRAAAGAESISDQSLRPGQSMTEGQAVSQGQYKCLELSNKDHQENRTGMFCGHLWDGLLCWDETPAGTSVTQNCPDRPDLDPTEKVTKYCDELGNWVQTGSTCQPASKNKLEKEVPQFLRDAAGEPTTEATGVNTEKGGIVEKLILKNEKKCSEKMKQDPPYNKSGLYCGRNWDGWLCWDDTPAGTYASQNCPDYFSDFDPTEKATKYCGEDGQWFRHPESSMTWTNYTLCAVNTKEKAAAQLSGDTEVEPADEATVSPMVNPEEQEIVRKKILDSQYKCFEKMNRDLPYNKSGLYCSRNWDGWLCWDDTPAGTYTSQNCPNYFVDFDPTEKATKYCGEDGQWFRHPDTNRTWSNYTLCNENTKAKLKHQTAVPSR